MSKYDKDPMGTRMKRYEASCSPFLIDGTPKIIRLDGKSFHTYLKGAKKPFDRRVIDAMVDACKVLMREIGGSARFAYIQSDECSIVLNDKIKITSEPWFGNKIQKMTSISSSIMSTHFTLLYSLYSDMVNTKPAYFDARVFQVPNETEMYNAILWRQFDASKNSISQYARSFFSHKQLHKKSGSDMQEMMFQEHNFNWNDAPIWTKRGVIVGRFIKDIEKGRSCLEADYEIPKFNEDNNYLINLYRGEQDEC